MVATKQTITKAEFERIQTPGRHDLVDGELWSMAPAQIPRGRFTAIIIVELENHVRQFGGGRVYAGELGFELDSRGRTILCPDASFLKAERVPSNRTNSFYKGAPDLAVEVISNSERAAEIQTKIDLYLNAGTAVVLCVYPEAQEVHIHNRGISPRVLGDSDTLDGLAVLPNLSVPLKMIFEES